MADKFTRREFIHDNAIAVTAAGAALTLTQSAHAAQKKKIDPKNIPSYNPEMEYRRCGRTDMVVSAVTLGGHWKRVVNVIGGSEPEGWMTEKIDRKDFQKNRHDVVTQCIKRGINYVDACCREEILAYAKALKGRRDKMYFGYSWHIWESRFEEWRPAKKLQEGLDQGMKEAGLDYVDIWRISLLTESSQHTDAEVEEPLRPSIGPRKADGPATSEYPRTTAPTSR